MLRARIAGRTVELIGCDTMAHAGDFDLFSCGDETADFRMTVCMADAIEPPTGDSLGVCGTMHQVRQADGRLALYNQSGQLLLSRDEAFTDVSLTLRRGLPKADILHYLHVMQSFSYHLLLNGGCLLHSAGMQLRSSGIALCGRSGVGKSTMAGHLQALAPSSVLCEDMPALTETLSGWTLHGTPFCGDDTQCTNASLPLRGIVLLRQAGENRVTCPTAQDALFELLSAAPRPVYSEKLTTIAADRFLRLSQQIPLLLFENDGTREAAELLLQCLKEREWID